MHKGYLLVEEGTDYIVQWSKPMIKADGHRTVDMTAVTMSGDTIPDARKNMTCGTLTEGLVYTRKIPDDSEKWPGAWEDAREDLIKNSFKLSTVLLHRYVKYDAKKYMNDALWAELLLKYPQN